MKKQLAPSVPSTMPQPLAERNGQATASKSFRVAEKTFQHELPTLLKQRNAQRRWVAYHGGDRIGFGRTKTELYRKCLELGLVRGDFLVRAVKKQVPLDAGNVPDV